MKLNLITTRRRLRGENPKDADFEISGSSQMAVSYTHLNLPTILLV